MFIEKKVLSKNQTLFGHPKPLFSLSLIEMWERFSFYGIRSLLILYMSTAMAKGGLGLSEQDASAITGIFGGFLYLATLPGGWLADNYFGQKKAILIGALLIATGHLLIALSFFKTFLFFVGLMFIVLGTGLFKTCASVMVGMLYKKGDTRRDSGFTIFYMWINFGAFIAPNICGAMQKYFSYHWGFGIGGLGMLLSIALYYFKALPDLQSYHKEVGLDKNWDIPATKRCYVGFCLCIFALLLFIFVILCVCNVISLNPVKISFAMVYLVMGFSCVYFLFLLFSKIVQRDEKKNLILFIILFIAASLFWSTFEQQPTTLNLFAQIYTDRVVFGFDVPTSWFQSINALFIIIIAPFMGALWTFLDKKHIHVSSLTKFAIGLIGAGAGFFIMFFAAKTSLANNGEMVSPLWLIGTYFCFTIGELALSPVGLSVMTKIAPRAIQSQVMGLWFVTLAVGNNIAGLIGGNVDSNNLAFLPTIFLQCVCILFAIALLLLFTRKYILKKLQLNL